MKKGFSVHWSIPYCLNFRQRLYNQENWQGYVEKMEEYKFDSEENMTIISFVSISFNKLMSNFICWHTKHHSFPSNEYIFQQDG